MNGVGLFSTFNPMAAISAANLRIAFNDMTDSVSHLSSGLRVATASDDPAGMAVAEMLQSDMQTLEQAIQRSGGRAGNKGSECARAALEMIDLLSKLLAERPANRQ